MQIAENDLLCVDAQMNRKHDYQGRSADRVSQRLKIAADGSYDDIEEWEQEPVTSPCAPRTMRALVYGQPRPSAPTKEFNLDAILRDYIDYIDYTEQREFLDTYPQFLGTYPQGD